MAQFSLNLPMDIPWKLIAVSPDMMDIQFCNKRFPFQWRSSLAISAFEPRLEDLPEQLCDERLTYLKVTASITGYQPTDEETKRSYIEFPDVPIEELDRILRAYFACWGVLLNVAVFPYGTFKKRRERRRIDFGELQPRLVLPNPYQTGPFTFQATDEPNNRTVDWYPQSGDQRGELNLFREMTVTFPDTSRVEAKVIHRAQPVTMEVYSGSHLLRSQTTGPQQGQIHDLVVEGEAIDRAIFKAPMNEAALLEFAIYEEIEEPPTLADYPHIIDFEPKTRDLYQSVSEVGEVLTASVSEVNTDKSFSHTASTETGISHTGKYTSPAQGQYGQFEASHTISHQWGQTDKDSYSTQTDSSRDRRERHGTSTNLSQMYNLLTGYHPGTNRAVFLMLPRPHILQPTDHRTFIQGLRIIEGVQDFFLIVTRPQGMQGLSVEVSLETGHFPEKVDVTEPPVEYQESSEDFHVSAYAKGGGGVTGQGAECKDIEGFSSAKYTISAGWVIDRRSTRVGSDPGHPGVKETGNSSNNQSNNSLHNYNYQAVSDSAVQVSGNICGANWWGPGAIFERDYQVLTRSEQPKPSTSTTQVTTTFLLTHRGLCASLTSGDKCVEAASLSQMRSLETTGPIGSEESIVDEQAIEINPALLTRDVTNQTRMPALKEMLRQIQFAMATSWRLRTRRPMGEVHFLDSDYFKNQIKSYLPEEVLNRRVADVPGLSGRVVDRLDGRRTVADVLNMDLPQLADQSGLSMREAIQVRRQLLGLPSTPGENGGIGLEQPTVE